MLYFGFSQGKGWLHEVAEDLRQLEPLPHEIPTDPQSWSMDNLAALTTWKRAVQHASEKHLLQERIAWDVQSFHTSIIKEFTAAGIEILDPSEVPAEQGPTHRCSDGSMHFATHQHLAAHAYRVHGHCSQERLMTQSTVCGGCFSF